MITRTTATGTIEYTGDLMAMFSPQPLIVTNGNSRKIRVAVTNGVLVADDERYPIADASGKYVSRFDISRLIQLVCYLDTALHNVSYGDEDSASTMAESITISVSEADGGVLSSWDIEAIYAACDAGEVIDNTAERRRIFVNYPSTIALGVDLEDNETVIRDALHEYYISNPSRKNMNQYDIMSNGDFSAEIYEHAEHRIEVSWNRSIRNGQEYGDSSVSKSYILVPDFTEYGKGVYLRWLHRDGSVGYWLFGKSKKTFSAAQGNGFTSHLPGVAAAPVDGVLRNAQKADFTIGESLTIGTTLVTAEEFDYLCGLVSSPVVEMLTSYNGTAAEWMRVNIAPGSFTRSYPRSGLRRTADFELAITLPKKNTLTF